MPLQMYSRCIFRVHFPLILLLCIPSIKLFTTLPKWFIESCIVCYIELQYKSWKATCSSRATVYGHPCNIWYRSIIVLYTILLSALSKLYFVITLLIAVLISRYYLIVSRHLPLLCLFDRTMVWPNLPSLTCYFLLSKIYYRIRHPTPISVYWSIHSGFSFSTVSDNQTKLVSESLTTPLTY